MTHTSNTLRALRIMWTPFTRRSSAAHAQASAAGSGRRRLRSAWRPAQAWATPRALSSARRADAEDYVDAVYMVLAAAACAQASAARNALAWNLRPTQAGQLKKGPALRSATHDPHKQHLAGAEDYVDAVYMALAAAHAQANAAGSGRRHLRSAWRPAQAWATPRTLSSARRADAEDYVDAVYMVLAAAACAQASAARNALALNLRPTQAGQLKKGPALRSATHDPHKQHLAGAEDYVDAVYTALERSPRPGKRSRIRSTASTQGLAACASLGNSTRSVVRPPCGR